MVSAFVMQYNSNKISAYTHAGHHEGPTGVEVKTGARPRRCGVGEGALAGLAAGGSA